MQQNVTSPHADEGLGDVLNVNDIKSNRLVIQKKFSRDYFCFSSASTSWMFELDCVEWCMCRALHYMAVFIHCENSLCPMKTLFERWKAGLQGWFVTRQCLEANPCPICTCVMWKLEASSAQTLKMTLQWNRRHLVSNRDKKYLHIHILWLFFVREKEYFKDFNVLIILFCKQLQLLSLH